MMSAANTTVQQDQLNNKRTYSVREIAEILQISRSRAYELCRENLFNVIKVGKSVRVSKRSFDEWLDRCEI